MYELINVSEFSLEELRTPIKAPSPFECLTPLHFALVRWTLGYPDELRKILRNHGQDLTLKDFIWPLNLMQRGTKRRNQLVVKAFNAIQHRCIPSRGFQRGFELKDTKLPKVIATSENSIALPMVKDLLAQNQDGNSRVGLLSLFELSVIYAYNGQRELFDFVISNCQDEIQAHIEIGVVEEPIPESLTKLVKLAEELCQKRSQEPKKGDDDNLLQGLRSICRPQNKYVEDDLIAFRPVQPPKPTTGAGLGIQPEFNTECSFVKLRSRSKFSSSVFQERVLKIQGSEILYRTTQGFPESTTPCVFILAGRGVNACLPDAFDGLTRVVLVITREQWEDEQIKQILEKNPDLDMLILNKLEGPHGPFAEDLLGKVNSRRIATFLTAHHFNVALFAMMDDNIKTLRFNAQGDGQPFDKLIGLVQSDGQQAWIHDIRTQSYNTLKYREGDDDVLGDKAFFIRGDKLFAHLISARDVFHFFLPPMLSSFWGEDYYFQTMVESLIQHHRLKESYHHSFPLSEASLERGTTGINQAQKATHKAHDWLEVELESLIPPCMQESWVAIVTAAFEHFKRNLQNDYDQRAQYRVRSKTMDPRAMFYGTGYVDDFSSAVESPLLENIKAYCRENLDLLHLNSLLMSHQRDAIQAWAQESTPKRTSLHLCTGAGKTMIQAAISYLAASMNTGRPVVVVAPTRNLVQQAKEDFETYFERFNQVQGDVFVPTTNIITVSSDKHSVPQQWLGLSQAWNQHNVIYIFCRKSFKNFMDSLDETSEKPSLVLLDEYHDQVKAVQKLMDHRYMSEVPVLGLTATPPDTPVFEHVAYEFSRLQGVKEKVICPMMIKPIEDSLSHLTGKELKKYLSKNEESFRTILANTMLPNGVKANTRKGILFFPSIEIADLAHSVLTSSGLTSFSIHSMNPNRAAELERFKQLPANQGAYLCAVRQLGVGFSDREVYWVRSFKKEDQASTFLQRLGRALRTSANDPNKIGYYMVPNDSEALQHTELFDRQAVLLADDDFLREYASKETSVKEQMGALYLTPTERNKMERTFAEHLNPVRSAIKAMRRLMKSQERGDGYDLIEDYLEDHYQNLLTLSNHLGKKTRTELHKALSAANPSLLTDDFSLWLKRFNLRLQDWLYRYEELPGQAVSEKVQKKLVYALYQLSEHYFEPLLNLSALAWLQRMYFSCETEAVDEFFKENVKPLLFSNMKEAPKSCLELRFSTYTFRA